MQCGKPKQHFLMMETCLWHIKIDINSNHVFQTSSLWTFSRILQHRYENPHSQSPQNSKWLAMVRTLLCHTLSWLRTCSWLLLSWLHPAGKQHMAWNFRYKTSLAVRRQINYPLATLVKLSLSNEHVLTSFSHFWNCSLHSPL